MFNWLKKRYHAWRYQRAISRMDFGRKSVSEIFTETYHKRYWKSRESVSGIGSELGQTAILRAELPHLLRRNGIHTLLDLPCGDFNWMQHVDLSGIAYTGGDIVADLMERNQSLYEREDRKFVQLNLLSDPLPQADCILIRDCLVHFSYEHIQQALERIEQSGIRYILTTTFTAFESNEDIQTGYWRPLNLERAPFHFPPPIDSINEGCTEAKGAYADKCLALWAVEGLPLKKPNP